MAFSGRQQSRSMAPPSPARPVYDRRELVFLPFSSPKRNVMNQLDLIVSDYSIESTEIFVNNLDPEMLPFPLDASRIVFCPRDCDFVRLKLFLLSVYLHGVADLRLDLSPESNVPSKFKFRFPNESELLRLSLRGCLISPSDHASSGLQSLQRLYIDKASFAEFGISSLISSIPFVQVLDIRRSTDLDYLCGGVPHLTTLTIVGCRNIQVITLSSPAMRTLYIRTASVGDFNIGPMSPMVDDAYLSWGMPKKGLDLMVRNRNAMISLLGHARVLTLGSLPLELMSSPSYFMLKEQTLACIKVEFRNLEELQLLIPDRGKDIIYIIYGFFHYFDCPNLKRLFIEFQRPCIPHDFPDGYVQVRPLEADLKKLEIVKLKNIYANSPERLLAESILKKAVNLQSMSLIASPTHGINYNHAELESYLDTKKISKGAVVKSYVSDTTNLYPTHHRETGPDLEF